jgi:hypothetical protein
LTDVRYVDSVDSTFGGSSTVVFGVGDSVGSSIMNVASGTCDTIFRLWYTLVSSGSWTRSPL